MSDFDRIPADQIKRVFDYDRRLLPNAYLAEKEEKSHDLASATSETGLSVGYPAWNLLYYSLLCSLTSPEPAIVETGTNLGFSTIVMAQALKDARVRAVVRTVDIDPNAVRLARQNAARAGIEEFISFSVGESLDFLRGLVGEADGIDFAFLDGNHAAAHVVSEFELIHPLVTASRGKVFFDNSGAGDVASALRHIRATFGGNLVEFKNCSWGPPGTAIWQP
ncbi:MAG: O-methyltransferase [Bryobacteraceae bacterium]